LLKDQNIIIYYIILYKNILNYFFIKDIFSIFVKRDIIYNLIFNKMAKILESDFRNGLYKTLVDAGYSKDEAKVIVGKQYFAALKDNLLLRLQEMASLIQKDEFKIELKTFEDALSELEKMKSFLMPKAEKPKD